MKTTLEQRSEALLEVRAGGTDDLGRGFARRWGRRVGRGRGAGAIGVARIGAIELMFLFAPLVIVPLGMELGRMVGGGIGCRYRAADSTCGSRAGRGRIVASSGTEGGVWLSGGWWFVCHGGCRMSIGHACGEKRARARAPHSWIGTGGRTD